MDEETVRITLFLTMVLKSKKDDLSLWYLQRLCFLVCKALQHLLLFVAWQVDKIIVEIDFTVW